MHWEISRMWCWLVSTTWNCPPKSGWLMIDRDAESACHAQFTNKITMSDIEETIT
jgi:hypothetical protein